ncbi:MAG: hypothetical protein R2847_00220 [Bacteroidia bacterium]
MCLWRKLGFGRRALFGINIFDWFRGGESGYVFCQLLRVYRQYFGIDDFEVEPYQYGQDNLLESNQGHFGFITVMVSDLLIQH